MYQRLMFVIERSWPLYVNVDVLHGRYLGPLRGRSNDKDRAATYFSIPLAHERAHVVKGAGEDQASDAALLQVDYLENTRRLTADEAAFFRQDIQKHQEEIRQNERIIKLPD